MKLRVCVTGELGGYLLGLSLEKEISYPLLLQISLLCEEID
jgi:hypothetical protein